MGNKVKRTIKGLRNDLGLTQNEMAEKLGVPIASYQRYENYRYAVPIEVLIGIADMCGITDLREIRYK